MLCPEGGGDRTTQGDLVVSSFRMSTPEAHGEARALPTSCPVGQPEAGRDPDCSSGDCLAGLP